jgi:MFS family permease
MIRKLLIIIMGIFLVIAAGSCNIYPLYLRNMMEKFDYSLKEVNLYGSFINIGLWVAFPMGYIYDKYGPKISCIIGAVLLSGSYTVLHLIMNSEMTSFSIVFMLILALMMGQGSALCYTTAVTTNLKNFRIKESSSIVGLLVANLAISPSIFTTYRQAFTSLHIANYFLMIAVYLAIIIAICGFLYTNIRNLYSEKIEYEKYK